MHARCGIKSRDLDWDVDAAQEGEDLPSTQKLFPAPHELGVVAASQHWEVEATLPGLHSKLEPALDS